jgi:hypothetical protein
VRSGKIRDEVCFVWSGVGRWLGWLGAAFSGEYSAMRSVGRWSASGVGLLPEVCSLLHPIAGARSVRLFLFRMSRVGSSSRLWFGVRCFYASFGCIFKSSLGVSSQQWSDRSPDCSLCLSRQTSFSSVL